MNVVTNIADSLSRSMAESIQTAVTAGILAPMQSLPAQGSNAQQRTDNEHSRTDAEDAASLVEVSAMQPRQVAHTEKADADEIDSAVTDILGSGEPLSSETPAQSTFCSTTTPLDSNVSLKTKNKVWAQEYVDLGVFVSSRTDEDEEFTINFSSSGKLSLQPVAKKGNVRDLTQWVAAFHVYMAVYLEKFPQAARSMIQYIKTIRDVDKSGGSWRGISPKMNRMAKPSSRSDI